MSSIWNTLSTVRTGKIKLLSSGRQLFGTVIKHGVNDKTVTVRVTSCLQWNNKYKRKYFAHRKKHVHDQNNICITGDRVIIASCPKLSKSKAYYVKSIVADFARPFNEKDKKYIDESQQIKDDKKTNQIV